MGLKGNGDWTCVYCKPVGFSSDDPTDSFFFQKDEILQNIKPKGNTPLQSLGAPPCPDPLIIKTPVDLSKVTAILYPGQERGGNFKPHGGFRFDHSKSEEIAVKAALDGYITDASRYIEMGEAQYMFDFQNDCGIRYRFDHLLVLSPKLAKIAENLPKAKENDSKTTHINESIKVTLGEVIATAVGFKDSNNVFVDFGVYDMRKSKPFQSPQENAVCWFDLLPASDSARVRSLPPGDSKSGTQSTLCK